MTWETINGRPGYHPAHRTPKHRADVPVDSCGHSEALQRAGRLWCHGCSTCDLCGVGAHRSDLVR